MANLDANVLRERGSILNLTTETLVTIYIVGVSGTHTNHYVGLEVSPDSTNWMILPGSIKGLDVETYQVAANHVRPIVVEAEGRPSTIDVFLVAR